MDEKIEEEAKRTPEEYCIVRDMFGHPFLFKKPPKSSTLGASIFLILLISFVIFIWTYLIKLLLTADLKLPSVP